LAGKNVSEMTYLVSGGVLNLNVNLVNAMKSIFEERVMLLIFI